MTGKEMQELARLRSEDMNQRIANESLRHRVENLEAELGRVRNEAGASAIKVAHYRLRVAELEAENKELRGVIAARRVNERWS